MLRSIFGSTQNLFDLQEENVSVFLGDQKIGELCAFSSSKHSLWSQDSGWTLYWRLRSFLLWDQTHSSVKARPELFQSNNTARNLHKHTCKWNITDKFVLMKMLFSFVFFFFLFLLSVVLKCRDRVDQPAQALCVCCDMTGPAEELNRAVLVQQLCPSHSETLTQCVC